MACATLKRNFEWESQGPAKRRRCGPISTSPSTSPGIKVTETKPSTFSDISTTAKLTPERVVQKIRNEIWRLRRRRQLRLTGGAASSSSGSEGDASPPRHQHHNPLSNHNTQDSVLFTFKQVRMICECMLNEQEAALRAEYEGILSGKLAEQYEAFLQFNRDQVQRCPPASCLPYGMDSDHSMGHEIVPSYLS